MDDLLANTLPAHVTTEVVSCESQSDVVALWRVEAGPDADASGMWLIHPAIARRTLDASRPPRAEHVVVFAQWSASLDGAAEDAIAVIAKLALDRPGTLLVMARHTTPDGPALQAELGNLRLGLIEARLTALGVAAPRLVREVLTADAAAQAEDVLLTLRPAP